MARTDVRDMLVTSYCFWHYRLTGPVINQLFRAGAGLARLGAYKTMRYRSQSTVQTFSGNISVTDLKFGGTSVMGQSNLNVIDSESLMWDDDSAGHSVKPVTHLSYVVDSLSVPHSRYHSADVSNAPNPRTRYDNAFWDADRLALYRPSSVFSNANGYISVTAASSNDVGNCVFNAYNQFVNGVRALDASTSIAESGETPQLFSAWQRRRGLATNLTSGFLSYAFGWKPLFSDFVAIVRELKSFPKTVRKRLKAIGEKEVVRHYKFNLSSTVDDVLVRSVSQNAPYEWGKVGREEKSVNKSRMVVVTIRARVKPKLTGEAQDLLNKLGALGLIPSLATVWSVTRLSFVLDWFYNIGGAIENLQGSLTHDISVVSVCVSDARTRVIELRHENTGGQLAHLTGRIQQRFYSRSKTTVPLLPVFRVPQRVMPYVLLGLLGLTVTNRGNRILRAIDGTKLSSKVSAAINRALDKIAPRKRREIIKTYQEMTLSGSSAWRR